MTDTKTTDAGVWEASDTPDLQRLYDQFVRAGGMGSSTVRKRRNDRIRYCRWDGRATDYKKHRELLRRDPIPWEDAWDGRVYTADDIIEELTNICLTAFARAQVEFRATGAEDIGRAANARKVFNKFVERDREALNEEAELMLQTGLGYGNAIWQIYWDRQVAMKTVPVKLDDLIAAAERARVAMGELLANPLTPALSPGGGQGGNSLAPALSPGGAEEAGLLEQLAIVTTFPQMIADPARETEAAEILQQVSRQLAAQLFGEERDAYGENWLDNYQLGLRQARKAIRHLRMEGECEFPAPYLTKNAPCVVAREVGYDYFGSPEMTDPEQAPWHIIREWLTPAQIKENQVTDGWDPAWCDEAIKTPGTSTDWGPEVAIGEQFDLDDEAEVLAHGVRTGRGELVEVLHAYVRYTTEQGVPQIWCTVFSPHVLKVQGKDTWARHYALDDSDSYGFYGFRWQRKRRNFHEGIGIPELVGSDQQLIKRTLDQLTDRADMELNPPWMVKNRLAMQYKFGPGAQMPRKHKGDLEPATPPTGSPALGFELIKDARYRLDNYFGRMTEHVLPARWQSKLQSLVGRFLGSARAMFNGYWKLIQKHADRAELERIAGGDPDFPRSPEEIQGEFDLSLYFDVKDLDMEFVFKKLEAVLKLAPLDRAGVLDLAQLIRLIVMALDPTLAQALIRDEQGAARMVYRDVDTEVLRMFAGNEAQYTELDPTAKRKLEFLSQIIAGNPRYQMALGFAENGEPPDPLFQARLEKYRTNLQMSVKQEEDAKVGGRLGVVPDNVALQAG